MPRPRHANLNRLTPEYARTITGTYKMQQAVKAFASEPSQSHRQAARDRQDQNLPDR